VGGTGSKATSRRAGARVFLVALGILATCAWQRDLFDADEGRYASVALGMVHGGDWVVPRLDGMPFMDKPPLVYWIQAVPTSLLGRHEILARLPTLLAGATWVLVVWLLAFDWTGSARKAWWAALLAATSTAGMVGSRVGPQMDMPLAAAVAVALLAGWRGVTRGGRGPRVLLGAAVGCGLLIKGPLVVAVPLLVGAAWVLAGVPARAVARVAFSPLAWGIAILLAAPWYVLVERAQPGWIAHFVTYEHLGRFTRGDHRAFNPLWFYVPIALLYLAPWTGLAFGGVSRLRAGGRFGRPVLALLAGSPWAPWSWDEALPDTVPLAGGRRVRTARLAWLWFLAAFLLYSVATRKLLNYMLPAAAPLFVLAGARLDALLGSRPARRVAWLPLLLGLGTVATGVLLLAGLWFPFATGRLPSSVEAPRWSPAGPWVVGAGLVLVAGAVAWLALRRPILRGAVLVGAAALAWWCADLGVARIGGIGSARELARHVAAREKGCDLVAAFKRYPQGLGFYGAEGADPLRLWIAGGTPDAWEQREIVNPYARRVWSAQADDGRGLPPQAAWRGGGLLTTEQLERLWASEVSVLLICRWGEVAHLGGQVVGGPFGGAGRTDLFLLQNHDRTHPDRR
jgi:4-amino-4-deoxy-L-arabinose transferase-like glycosyltransferase